MRWLVLVLVAVALGVFAAVAIEIVSLADAGAHMVSAVTR